VIISTNRTEIATIFLITFDLVVKYLISKAISLQVNHLPNRFVDKLFLSIKLIKNTPKGVLELYTSFYKLNKLYHTLIYASLS